MIPFVISRAWRTMVTSCIVVGLAAWLSPLDIPAWTVVAYPPLVLLLSGVAWMHHWHRRLPYPANPDKEFEDWWDGLVEGLELRVRAGDVPTWWKASPDAWRELGKHHILIVADVAHAIGQTTMTQTEFERWEVEKKKSQERSELVCATHSIYGCEVCWSPESFERQKLRVNGARVLPRGPAPGASTSARQLVHQVAQPVPDCDCCAAWGASHVADCSSCDDDCPAAAYGEVRNEQRETYVATAGVTQHCGTCEEPISRFQTFCTITDKRGRLVCHHAECVAATETRNDVEQQIRDAFAIPSAIMLPSEGTYAHHQEWMQQAAAEFELEHR